MHSKEVEGVKSRSELLAHCTYHAFRKTDMTVKRPKYHNAERDFIFATGLFPWVPPRAQILPAPDSVWLKKFRDIFGKEN